MEQLEAHRRLRNGCASLDFLLPGEAMILTLADLFRKGVGPDWQKTVSRLPNFQSKVHWMVEQTVRLAGLEHFGVYLTLLFGINMLFGNENRHLNNIAVLRRGERFSYCPLFDFGAGLLSNVRDYPMEIEPKTLVRQLRARPLDTIFARQVHAAEAAYGVQLEWDFDLRDIGTALAEPLCYYEEGDMSYIRDRAAICIKMQQAKLER